jgi:glycosyltransferase involved in cell wall biosynthesis
MRFRAELNLGLAAARRIASFERKYKLELLHFHTQAAAYGSIRRMRRIPTVISIDATQQLMSLEAPSEFERRTYQPNILWDRKIFRAAKAIISASSWAAQDLARNYPESAHKVTVIPWPVRVQNFSGDWISERSARANGRVVFLFMGNDFQRKGGPELLQTWRDLKLPNAFLKVATGVNSKVPELPPGVELIRGIQPHTPEWKRLWMEADVFVLPTKAEALGLVFREAAAAGLPAIGTLLNAIPELVIDGETGVLVQPGDVGALAQAMKTLSESSELRQRMGARARARILETGTTEYYASQFTKVLECGELFIGTRVPLFSRDHCE